MKSIFSVDVEDWFHISGLPNTPELPAWNLFSSRVENNFIKLLDIFSQKNIQVTCFFLGWIGQKFPHLVKEAHRRGHEIASHGFSHKLCYEMSESEFLQDICKAKNILENISGKAVLGYRAPAFSVTKDTPWFFDKLIEAGYTYDSSIFPAPRSFGGLATENFAPYTINNSKGGIVEFPISAVTVMGKPLCFFGGGYLRLSPYMFIKHFSLRIIKDGRPVIFYIHPREIDPQQPRLPMNLQRKFNSYVNIKSTEAKIKKILNDFEITTFSQFMNENKI